MRYLVLGLWTCILMLASCNERAPLLEGQLVLSTSTAARVIGSYSRGGVSVSIDLLQTDAQAAVIVRAGDGMELLRMERKGDFLISTAFGGRAKVTYDLSLLRLSNAMASLPEKERPAFSLAGAMKTDGDQRAFEELEQRPEYAMLPWLSRELGVQGFTGTSAPVTLGFHMIAMQAARDLNVDLPQIDSLATAATCLDLQSDPHGNNALGMCGPGSTCWNWVCGDCCCHDGCKSHDNSCRNCKWYKPWNCFLCASFLSFVNGGCGTSCQSADYAEPSCRPLWGACTDSSQCCDHYSSASEVATGTVNVICGTLGTCVREGSCRGNCEGRSGTCGCDVSCTFYGDCCWDRDLECRRPGPIP
jgi:hypothetical protein